MKIDLARLALDRLRFELPHVDGKPGASRSLELGPSSGVSGTMLDAPDALRFQGVQAESLAVAKAGWTFGSIRVELAEALHFQGLQAELELPRGKAAETRGHVARIGGAAHAHRVAVSGASWSVQGELRAKGLSYTADATKDLKIGAAEGVLTNVTVGLGSGPISITTATIRELLVRIPPTGPTTIAAGKVELARVEVVVGASSSDAQGTRITLEGVVLSGAAYAAGAMGITAIEIRSARVAADLPQGSGAPADAEAAAPGAEAAAPDLSELRRLLAPLLDRLEGHIHLDISLDATVPVLGVKTLTEHVRLPVESGAIPFKKLEHDLSTVVDAILDFEVAGDKLVLEVDPVPLLKHDNITLVEWPLDTAEQSLAKQELVRLSTLLGFRLGDPDKRKKDKPKKEAKEVSPSALRRLDFDAIDVELEVRGLAHMELGPNSFVEVGTDNAEVASMNVALRGEIKVPTEARVPSPTVLEGAARDIRVKLSRVAAGERAVSGRLEVRSVEDIKVTFAGVKPQSVTVLVGELHGQEIKFGPR